MARRLVGFVAAAVAVLGATIVTAPAIAGPNVVAAQWSSAGSPKHPVYQTGAAFLKGKVYMPGGWDSSVPTAYDKMQILKTSASTWSTDSEPMPAGALAQMAVCTDGKTVSVVNGIDGNGAVKSVFQIYDPSQPQGSRWSTGPSPFTSADGFVNSRDGGCAWLGGKLYLFGGDATSTKGTLNGISDFTLEYDPVSQTWSNTGLPMVTDDWTFGYASDGSSAYVAGGRDDQGTYLRTVQRFAPGAGWTALTKLPKPKNGGIGFYWPGVGFLGNQLAVFGGDGGTGYLATTYVCTLPCDTAGAWTNAHKNLKTARADFAYASGGSTPTLYAIDGQGLGGVISKAEKTT